MRAVGAVWAEGGLGWRPVVRTFYLPVSGAMGTVRGCGPCGSGGVGGECGGLGRGRAGVGV